jgi:NDP-sugar pyrophosphorylase family protein
MINLVMPMAGAATRFVRAGIETPKPLLLLHGKPAFEWAARSVLEQCQVAQLVFVVLRQHVEIHHIDTVVKKVYPDAEIQTLNEVLKGPVLTCEAGVKLIKNDLPVIFNDCDHLFVATGLSEFIRQNREEIAGALLHFHSSSPAYSYASYNHEGNLLRTAEKDVISNKAICGAYYFKNKQVFQHYVDCYKSNCPYDELFMSGVYNEMVGEGETIRGFDLEYHLPFGTPQEHREAKSADFFRAQPTWLPAL